MEITKVRKYVLPYLRHFPREILSSQRKNLKVCLYKKKKAYEPALFNSFMTEVSIV